MEYQGDFTSEGREDIQAILASILETNCSQVRYKDEHLFGGNGPGRIWGLEGEERRGKCIDDRLIESITGHHLDIEKDDTPRELSCGCVKRARGCKNLPHLHFLQATAMRTLSQRRVEGKQEFPT